MEGRGKGEIEGKMQILAQNVTSFLGRVERVEIVERVEGVLGGGKISGG